MQAVILPLETNLNSTAWFSESKRTLNRDDCTEGVGDVPGDKLDEHLGTEHFQKRPKQHGLQQRTNSV